MMRGRNSYCDVKLSRLGIYIWCVGLFGSISTKNQQLKLVLVDSNRPANKPAISFISRFGVANRCK
jgi:hypothetical protein